MSYYDVSFPSTIIITHKNGATYDLGKLGYRVKSFDPPSPNYSHTFQQIGKHGTELVDTSTSQITIPLVLDIKAYDTADFELSRMKLKRIFYSEDEFYVSTVRLPYIRWKVTADPYTAGQLNSFWQASNVTINLQCAEGYAESIATTSDPMIYQVAKWGLEENLSTSRDLKYKWNTPNISFYNASNIDLLAEEHPVAIIFDGNARSGIKLKNITTNQEINVYRALKKGHPLIWHGFVPVVDSKQQYGNGLSDHGYLDFARGWNILELTGSNDFTISFETRFYY